MKQILTKLISDAPETKPSYTERRHLDRIINPLLNSYILSIFTKLRNTIETQSNDFPALLVFSTVHSMMDTDINNTSAAEKMYILSLLKIAYRLKDMNSSSAAVIWADMILDNGYQDELRNWSKRYYDRLRRCGESSSDIAVCNSVSLMFSELA